MSYFILPTQKISIQTKETPLEVLDCLKLQVENYWYSDDELKFKKNEGFFVGKINGYRFNIRKKGARKLFTPLINGNIRGIPEGSIIDIAIGIHYFEIIFTILILMISLISSAPITFKLGIVLLFILGLFGYEIDRREVRDFMKKILS